MTKSMRNFWSAARETLDREMLDVDGAGEFSVTTVVTGDVFCEGVAGEGEVGTALCTFGVGCVIGAAKGWIFLPLAVVDVSTRDFQALTLAEF